MLVNKKSPEETRRMLKRSFYITLYRREEFEVLSNLLSHIVIYIVKLFNSIIQRINNIVYVGLLAPRVINTFVLLRAPRFDHHFICLVITNINARHHARFRFNSFL